jgi:hypothetical protein
MSSCSGSAFDNHYRSRAVPTKGSSALYPALVKRSITAWNSLNYVGEDQANCIHKYTEMLKSLTSERHSWEMSGPWFFQRKESFV